jgi:type VI secretion system protein ImpJ
VNQSIAEMRVGQLSFRLVLASDPIDAYGTLSVARVQEYNSSRAVTLDTSHIIPCLDCTASGVLRDYLREISGLLTHRAVSLAARLGQPGQRGVAEVTDYLILQIANRYDPLFRHLLTRALMHPEMLYRLCLQIAGELSTYTQAKHRPVDFPSYRHDALRETFAPLMASLRDALTAVLDQRAVPIKIEDLGNSVYRASIPDTDLLRSGNFVLAVNAQMSSEKLRRDFPNQVKLGPQDKLRDLVMSHLPGIGLIAQPVAPRQLPYHAGFTYFELDRSGGLWKEIEKSRVLALHVAGDFPELQMELWGIRS